MQLGLGEAVLAVGALGTAAFGVVEGMKAWSKIGEAGFDAIPELLGGLQGTLIAAYGPEALALLRAQYRGDQSELARMLRQGVRAGLSAETAPTAAGALPAIGEADLRAAVVAMNEAAEPAAAQRNTLGRFELAADARIDAALALARSRYVAVVRVWAGVVAIVLAVAAAVALQGGVKGAQYVEAILIGIAAVPLAPIAKDIASGLNAASRALRRE